jgi:hypothetical protein
VIHQLADEHDLDARPDLTVLGGLRVGRMDLVHGLPYAAFVALDAFAVDLGRARPVGVFETLLALPAELPEQAVMAVEAVQDGLCNA